jgi:hypothetical protein
MNTKLLLTTRVILVASLLIPADAQTGPTTPDEDHDGIPDWRDQCPNTPDGILTDDLGCATSHMLYTYTKSDTILYL